VAHLRGERRYDPGQDDVHVSAVTRAELIAGRGTDAVQVARLLAPMSSVDVDKVVADRAGQIQRQSGVSLTTALLVAAAMEHELTLVTLNLFAYRGIAGLHAMAPS
jgi:predicted nucleic acid-binding protein